MAAPFEGPVFGDGVIRRERFRRVRMTGEEKQEIVRRVLEFADNDIAARADDRELRLQRYAKYRQWTEGKSWPWEGASDIALPDITEACLNLQDTLTNAILSSRPVVNANATRKDNADKETGIDRMLDHQFFVEQLGEKTVEELSELFLIDGKFTAFVPWIREKRPVTDLRIFDPIPLDQPPVAYFETLLNQEFRGAPYFKQDEEGWDYRIEGLTRDGKDKLEAEVAFYTRALDDSVEMIIRHEPVVFDGPLVIVKDYDDVLVPPRVANLQPPSPKNPGGAPHVILVDYPTVDEIEGLKRDDFYDLVRRDDVEDLGLRSRDTSDEAAKEQKDTMQGALDEEATDDEHKTFTRYTCFDVYDLDGDGIPEDVIWWVIREEKLLLKAKPLTEMYPADPPRRPLAEAQFLPIKGRHEGIGLPELMEGMHDFLKATMDQGMDGGTLASTPFFFYRAASSLKPEVLRPWPGDGIPLSDPQRDVHFPQIPFDGSFSLNAFAAGRQLEERLTLIGDLQGGRVPAGKSSALRTVGGINTILAQGEARPERILRRFFMGFAEIFKQMHELNQHFLPEIKSFRVLGMVEPGENPYPEIVRDRDLDGRFVFDFRASILNASKQAKQEGLMALLETAVDPLMMQLGIVTPETIFRMIRDWAQSTGNDPDRYLNEPTPLAGRRQITANEAIAIILDHLPPDGLPKEGAEAHFKALQEFAQSPNFGLFDISQVNIFRGWLIQVAQLAQQEAAQQQMAQMAGNFQQKLGVGADGNGAAPPLSEPGTRVNKNELIDESLPGAGGGANPGPGAS